MEHLTGPTPNEEQDAQGVGSTRLRRTAGGARDVVVWSIAGFDPSSGAGITADLMTFAAHGLFGCSAITATTMQNTMGVLGSIPAEPEALLATLACLDEDLPPRGVKIGMLATPALASALAGWLRARRLTGRTAPVVVLDPVLRSTSGAVLFSDEGLPVLREQLLPEVDWVTPNWSELAVLTGMPVDTPEGVGDAAGRLGEMAPRLQVVVTGGDQQPPADLLLSPGGVRTAVNGRHIATRATHGTGCAFSSALLCGVVLGLPPVEAVRQAKAFVEGALERAPGLGKGRGPTELLWPLR